MRGWGQRARGTERSGCPRYKSRVASLRRGLRTGRSRDVSAGAQAGMRMCRKKGLHRGSAALDSHRHNAYFNRHGAYTIRKGFVVNKKPVRVTDAELAVLKLLWARGEIIVGESRTDGQGVRKPACLRRAADESNDHAGVGDGRGGARPCRTPSIVLDARAGRVVLHLARRRGGVRGGRRDADRAFRATVARHAAGIRAVATAYGRNRRQARRSTGADCALCRVRPGSVAVVRWQAPDDSVADAARRKDG
jgi:hypothetical protein